MAPFEFYKSEGSARPLLISVPHAGTFFPGSCREQFDPGIVSHPPDTDWWVDKLYDFAPKRGIALIKANYSRYVIDLNRRADDSGLYPKDRFQTRLFPDQTFDGQKLLLRPLRSEEKRDRIEQIYKPYYQKITTELAALRESHQRVLLVDAHSIRRLVPSIQSQPFPDLILSNRKGQSCREGVIQKGAKVLRESYQVTINDPFQGGAITEAFGAPDRGIEALQLEMSQDLYWNEGEWSEGAFALKGLLEKFVLELAEEVACKDSGGT